jgi:peptidyl-prolyl cis-trans isomerase D
MFDLFRSREKSVRLLLGILLGLVALAMVITLVPSYGSLGGAQQDPSVIAEIGDTKITASDVRQVLARELKSQQVPKGLESVYLRPLITQMVNERALALYAAERGFHVTDEELAKTIRQLLPMLYENGKFIGKEAYASVVERLNLTIPQFESDVRKQMLASRLESLVLEGVIVTPAEIEEAFRRAKEKIKVSYFSINSDQFRAKSAPTQAEVLEHFNKSRSSYSVPEKRALTVYSITEDRIAATLSVKDSDIERAYASNLDRFRTPERVRVRHILLKTQDKPASEVAAIQKKAEDLLKQVKSGADFAQLATKNSEDPGSAAKGGDLDWVTRGQTVPEFEQSAFSLKVGEISNLVKTLYGFHILKVEAKEDARVRPLAEVKEELRKELLKGEVFNKMQTVADQIRAALVKSPAEAEQLAKSNGISPVRVDKAGRNDPIPEVGVQESFSQAVFSLPKNGVTPVITIGTNKLVFAQVAEIFPEHPAEFADVENEVRQQLQSVKGMQLVNDLIASLESKAKAGADFAALAKEAGAAIKTSSLVERTGSIEGFGLASSAEEVFKKKPGEIAGPIRSGPNVFFMRLDEKVPADLTELAAQRDILLNDLKNRRARDRRALFIDGVIQKLVKEKKVKIYEDSIDRLIAAYRG